MMKHQQAVYLQEMGITRWQVRKPELFAASDGAIELDLSQYSLLIVGQSGELSHPLMVNILKAFGFTADDVYLCSIDEFENYQGMLPGYIWSMVGQVNQPRGHQLLTSSPLSKLRNCPEEKRALWEQFCAFNR